MTGASLLTIGSAVNNNITAELLIESGGIFNTGTGQTLVRNSGTLTVNAGGTLNVSGDFTLVSGVTLTNDGDITFSNSSTVQLAGPIANNGTIRLDGHILASGTGLVSVSNDGIIEVDGEASMAFTNVSQQMLLTNRNELRILTDPTTPGQLRIAGADPIAGQSVTLDNTGGTITIGVFAALEFLDGESTLRGGTINGAGNVVVSRVGGFMSHLILEGGVTLDGVTVDVSPGDQLTLRDSLTNNATVRADSGNPTIDVPVELAEFTVGNVGGNLFVNAQLTTAVLNWNAGAFHGTGSVVVTGTGTIDPANGQGLNNLQLVNQGDMTWTDGDFGGNAGTLRNEGQFTIDLTTARNFSPSAVNTAGGTITLQGGMPAFGPPMNNAGLVQVDGGVLVIISAPVQHVGSVLTGGSWDVRDNATLNFIAGSDIVTNQGTVILRGPGSVFTKIDSLADNQGTFEIHDARNFDTVGKLTNSGQRRLKARCPTAPTAV